MIPFRHLWYALTAGALTLASLDASAALTASEQAQIKGFAAGAQVQNAARVRALVARPDLSIEESTAILADALGGLPFNDARASFVRELLFGGASATSRPVLVVAGTRAILTRADALLGKYSPVAPDLDAHADALAELSRIYNLIGGDIASAGHPQGAQHDPSAGIPASAYDDCAKALSEHVQRNPRWLRPDAATLPPAAHVRSQALLALYEMMNDSPTRKVDAADRIGLRGARRAFLTELGILVLDSGKADDTRVARVRAIVDRMRAARADLEAIVFGDTRALLRSRGPVLGIHVPLESTAAQAGYAVQTDEVEPGPLDLPLFVLAYELANTEVRRALDNRPDLSVQAAQDLGMPATGVTPGMSLEQRLAAVVAQLVVDAPRTMDLAFGRLLAGKPQSTAVLSDALGVLAAFAPSGDKAAGLVIPVGRPRGDDGGIDTLALSNVRLLPSGAVLSFTETGRKWELHRDASGVVDSVRRDATPVSLAMLPSARLPVTDGTTWSAAGVVFARMQGTPRAGVAPGPRVRMVGIGERGFDAIVTPAPGDDLVLEAELIIHGPGAGLVVRAISGTEVFSGASLLILPGAAPKAVLRASDGKTEADLASPVDLRAAPTYKVKMTLKGNKLDVKVNDVALHANLPLSLAHGDVALRARRGATVEATTFSMKRL